MTNSSAYWVDNNSPIMIGIQRDFTAYKNILRDNFQIPIHDQLDDSIRITHFAISLLNGYCQELFFNQSSSLIQLSNVSIHLLNCAIISSLRGDSILTQFALRGSLEATGKEMASLNSIFPTGKFSNDIEKNISFFKKSILEKADKRTQHLQKLNYPLTQKRMIKSKFDHLVDYGRTSLYGRLSETIHLRSSASEALATTLVEMSKAPGNLSAVIENLQLVLKVSTYELMILQLNEVSLTSNCVSFARQELIDSFFRESNIPHLADCVADFVEVSKFTREFI